MAECLANVAIRSIQPGSGVGRSGRNAAAAAAAPAGVVFLYNPLGCNLSKSRYSRVSVCVRASSSSQEPIQAEEECEKENNPSTSPIEFASSLVSAVSSEERERERKKRNRKGERETYLLAAIASSIGFTTMSAGAVYYRFYSQMQVRILSAAIAFGERSPLSTLFVCSERLTQLVSCSQGSSEVPYSEIFGTFALAIGAAVMILACVIFRL